MQPVLDYRRVTFVEEQRFDQWWFSGFAVALASIAITGGVVVLWAGALGRAPVDGRAVIVSALLLLIGIAVALLSSAVKMVTAMDADHLRVGFRPLPLASFPLRDIQFCEVKTYDAMRDHGGRGGVRVRDRSGWAYTTTGDRGVDVVLTTGEHLFIGSQRADELAAALRERLAATQPESPRVS